MSPVLQHLLEQTELAKSASPAVTFVGAGMASGFLAAFVTQPVDTIKTRVQVSLSHCDAVPCFLLSCVLLAA